MPRFGLDDSSLNLPVARRGLLLNPVDVRCRPRRSSSYQRLPQPLLKLSIIKLDGSSFDVQVARTATVSELKLAVEEVFTQSPEKGHGKISWSHVWGHFCLCYQGNKLINDKISLRTFGIKDGDQLHFMRHLSVSYNPIMKGQHQTQNESVKHQPLALAGPDSHEGNDNHEKHNIIGSGVRGDMNSYQSHHEEKSLTEHTEFKLAHFIRGWLSYTRLWRLGRRRPEERSCPPRFAGTRLKSWNQGYTILHV